MIGYVDIKRSVIDVLKTKVSTIKTVATEELNGFKPPAFFVQLMPISDTPSIDYEEKLLTVNIHYFSEEKTDLANLKMLDQLNTAFFNVLKIGDRVITLKSKRHQLIDNVLQFKFELEFLTDIDVVEVNDEWLMSTELDDSLGYSEETVELMQELDLKEE
ncbi:phage tail terminator family protein [Desulfosporosinus lacus]|uniref:Uncharacterized protein n=1 Tax=Desulfosporosinus lacus DSM 15449 TaxID=1121420 RepID=A0A1M5QL24_9FIRM|nr:hypothetical protein [Desulfosporosinus lacus]SHH14688.1 hypothetical protein SAMN02746098_00293 [Desulfosporosinus lacus DSM 15449]